MMLKEKKLEYQRACEEYIEQKKLYETFEEMMRSLIINRPKDPIKHLIEKLQCPEGTCPRRCSPKRDLKVDPLCCERF